MVAVTSPIKDTYELHPERGRKSTVVWYYRRIDTWVCERCGTSQGTSKEDCMHVRCVKETL